MKKTYNKSIKAMLICLLAFTGTNKLNAQVSETYNFDNTGDLNAYFKTKTPNANIIQGDTFGISLSGAVHLNNSANSVFVTKQGFHNFGVGAVYTASTYFKSEFNNGYGGIGITSDSNATYTQYAAPATGLGISCHGGGYIFTSNTSNVSGSWTSSIYNLLNNGSPDKWYKVVLTITPKINNEYDLQVKVYSAYKNGTLIRNTPDATQTATFTNTTMASAPVLYSYFAFGGTRITNFDNYSTTLVNTNFTCQNSRTDSNYSICSSKLPLVWNGLTLTSTGKYTKHFTKSGGCDSAITLNLSVIPNPSVVGPINNYKTNSVISSAVMCQLGDTLQLINWTKERAGDWSSTNPAVASVSTTNFVYRIGKVVANATGVSSINFNLPGFGTGGCPLSSSVLVTVNPIAAPSAIIGSANACIGTPTYLSSSTPGGVWSSLNDRGTINTISSNLGAYTGVYTGTGNLKYTVTNSNGCSASVSKTIVVKASPAIPAIGYAPGTPNPQSGAPTGSYCANRTFTVAGAPTGGAWSSTNSGGATFSISPLGVVTTGSNAGAGSIKYTISNASGCSSSKTLSGNVFVCAARGVTTNEKLETSNDFTLYPNPAKSFISINVNSLIGTGSIVVTDLYGKTVKTQLLGMGSNTVDIAKLTKGMYFVSIVTSEGKSTKKLIVE